MSVPAASPPTIDPASRSLLEGLGSLHAAVLAVDAEDRIVFLRDPEALLGAVGPTSLATVDDDAPASVAAIVAALSGGEPTPDVGVCVRCFEVEVVGDAPSPLRVALVDVEPSGSSLLEKKNAELETCVRSVSHDLRSPLVSVLGFTRLLRDEFGEPIGRTGLHFLDRIEQAGRNMERLLHDMLELTRLEDTPSCPVHVNPTAVLEQLAAEQKPALDEASIELVVPQEAPIVVCDRTRFYQLFSNLVGNAIRHVPHDGTGRIEVRVERDDTGWRLGVEDNGPGIAPEDRDRIFDAFRTAKHARPAADGASVDKRGKSSGLGLAIVRKIVELHGGTVRVDDAPGGGAAFHVWLPLPAATEPEAAD